MVLFSYIVFFFLINFSYPQGSVDGIAAIVGENIVLHSDVLQQARFVAMERGVDPLKSPYLFEEIYHSALNSMINQYVVLGAAEKDTNLVLSNDEVDRALDQQIENFIIQAGSEKLFLEMAGQSMRQIKSDYWKDIRDMMMIERYQFSIIQNVDVSRLEVEFFFETNKDSIPIIPDQYSFSIIETPFIAGQGSENEAFSFLDSLKNNIEKGYQSFDSLAQKHSQDPGTSQSGGYLGYTTRGSLVKEYEEVAYSLLPGSIGGPVKTPFGYHIIRLIDRQGEKISTQHILRTIDFSDEDKKNIIESLNGLLLLINNDPFLFDSVSNIYSNKYNNSSGIYSGVTSNNIPDNILSELLNLNVLLHDGDPSLSSPIETIDGCSVIYLYNYINAFYPNLENSWNLLYEYTKQDKQTKFFNTWVESVKTKTYIKIFYN